MKRKPITIVTITYNSSSTIIPLLKSIAFTGNSELVDMVIIIENNSPDSAITRKKISVFLKEIDIPIHFINSKQNNGYAKSCNLGASIAKTDYVLFLNPDTQLKKKSLRILYEHALINQADIIGGISLRKTNEVHKTVVRHPNLLIGLFELTNLGKLLGIKSGHKHFYYEDINNLYHSGTDLKVDAVGGAYLMVRRQSYNNLGGFDTGFFMYLEDVDLGYRANQKNMSVIFCPHSIISHIGGASSTNKQHIRHQAWYDSRKYYFAKHYGRIVNLLVQPIFTLEELLLKLRNR